MMKVPFKRYQGRCVAIAILGVLCAASPAQAADINFNGKSINFYVGGGVGGGVDAFARAFAPYLGKYLPGTPPITIVNMGASGGLQGVQYLFNVAAKDGTAIGTTNAGPISEPLMGQIKVNYDLKQFKWVGSLTRGDTVCAVWHGSQAKSLEDARVREFAMSATGATSAPTRSALLMNALLHTRFKPVPGYDGGSALLAIERQEVDGTCTTLGSLRTTRPEWLKSGQLQVLLQVAMDTDPEFPDAPGVADLVTDPQQRKMLEWFLIPYEFNNPIILPPGVNSDVITIYRTAFDKAVRDPQYLLDAKRLSQRIVPHTGAEVEDLVGRLLGADPETIRRVIEATDLKSAK